MHHQGHETTEVGDDHFRSTGVKLWAAVARGQDLGLKGQYMGVQAQIFVDNIETIIQLRFRPLMISGSIQVKMGREGDNAMRMK